MKKRLYKVEQGKIISGVCGGIAEYFDIDPTLIRVGVAVLACLTGGGFVVGYVVCACIMPKKSDVGE